jgi:hypothetical protein
MLAARLGKRDAQCERNARRYLEASCVDGCVTTYPRADEIRRYVEAKATLSFAGWTQPHACVTGAAAQLPSLRERLIDGLILSQTQEGFWQSYWWFDDAYATAMAVAALSAVPLNRYASVAIEKACRWARRLLQQPNLPSSFALALLLTLISHKNGAWNEITTTVITSTVAKLLELQAPEGYWAGTARLRIPSPDETRPDLVENWQRWWGCGTPFNIYSVDQCSIFTTATVTYALQKVSLLSGARS